MQTEDGPRHSEAHHNLAGTGSSGQRRHDGGLPPCPSGHGLVAEGREPTVNKWTVDSPRRLLTGTVGGNGQGQHKCCPAIHFPESRGAAFTPPRTGWRRSCRTDRSPPSPVKCAWGSSARFIDSARSVSRSCGTRPTPHRLGSASLPPCQSETLPLPRRLAPDPLLMIHVEDDLACGARLARLDMKLIEDDCGKR
jgi:hypothetical protein